MYFYPLFLNVTGLRILVAGCGSVGLRKLRSLAGCGAKIIEVVDPHPHIRELDDLAATNKIRHRIGTFEVPDLDGKALVFAATSDPAVNLEIIRLCMERTILCSSADSPQSGSFYTPAHFHLDGVTVAIGTSGQSPALAARIKCELKQWFSGRYTGLTTILGKLRPALLALGLTQEENARIFKIIADSSLGEEISKGEFVKAATLLRSLLPTELHSHVDSLVKEYL